MVSVCRICMSECERFVDVSENREGLLISVIVMIICPIKIESSDSLPKQICEQCLEVVLSAYKLRDVSNNTDRYFRSYQEEIHSLEIEDDMKNSLVKVLSDEQVFSSIHAEPDEEDDTTIGLENDIIEEEDILSKEDYVVYGSEDEEILEASSYVELDGDPNFKFRVDCQNHHTKKSAVWKYIGVLVDETGKVVEKEKDSYFCKICVEQHQTMKPKYKVESTATSVLFSHLNRVHALGKSDMSENHSFNASHQVPELVSCEVCEKSFNSGSLNIHMGIEHINGSLSRNYGKNLHYKVNCFKTSSKSLAWDYFGALENHDGEQLDEYYFYCRLCVEEEGKLNPKYTKNTSTSILLQHLKNSHIPKTPEEMAKRKLPEPIVLTSNKRMKSDDFTCKLCGESLESKKSLNRHLAKEHNEEQPRNFTCQIESCNKSFTMRDTLLKHMKNIHQGTKYPCDRCPTVLSTRMSLRRHIESCHLKLKSFVCDSCNATYTEQKSLKNHIQKVHLGILEKKIACDHCELMFPNQWSMRRHLLTHTGEVRK